MGYVGAGDLEQDRMLGGMEKAQLRRALKGAQELAHCWLGARWAPKLKPSWAWAAIWGGGNVRGVEERPNASAGAAVIRGSNPGLWPLTWWPSTLVIYPGVSWALPLPSGSHRPTCKPQRLTQGHSMGPQALSTVESMAFPQVRGEAPVPPPSPPLGGACGQRSGRVLGVGQGPPSRAIGSGDAEGL